MACIVDEGNGRKRIEFGAVGLRKKIRLGKASQRQAQAFLARVDMLVYAARIGQPPDPETAGWIAGLDDTMKRRLARAGLYKPNAHGNATLADLMREFFAALSIKSGTRTTYEQTKASLVEFFGDARPLRDIGPLEADKFRQHLAGKDLAEATISKRIKTARQAFKRAVRWKMIDANPFDDVKAGAQTNKSRQFFIGRDVAQQVFDQCPDAQWRLIFALSRFGGLRCPSEHLALKWRDVDWEHNRITITSPKTEHYAGGESRVIPIFPELRPYLQDCYDVAELGGSEFVITRYRDANQNLRTQLLRIMRRAGVKAWPRLFHNLRSTRQTELEETYPSHVVCAWLGNSEKVARAHYLQLTDDHFAQAVAGEKESGRMKAARIPALHTSARAVTGAKPTFAINEKTPVFPGLSAPCRAMTDKGLTPTGFEPVSRP